MNRTINTLFEMLDQWRHLPAYQLERRADVFFALYLPELIQSKLGTTIASFLPEFPIRRGTIGYSESPNKSFKIDYLAMTTGGDVIFVELKTDDASRRQSQDAYLLRAKQEGMVRLLEGILAIYYATSSKNKYRHLVDTLDEMGLIVLEGDLLTVQPVNRNVDILYIQPHNPHGNVNVLTFHEAAEVVSGHSDVLSQRFAQSLREWAAVEAGDR
jgi:hypothetical protein